MNRMDAASRALLASSLALFAWCAFRLSWILPFGSSFERSHGLLSLLLSASLLAAGLLIRRLFLLLARARLRILLLESPFARRAERRAVGE